MTTAINALCKVTNREFLSRQGDQSYDLAAGELLVAVCGANVTLTVNLPEAGSCLGAPCAVKRVTSDGVVMLTAADREGIDGANAVQVGGSQGAGGLEQLTIRATDDATWSVESYYQASF